MPATDGVGLYVLIDGLGWEIVREHGFLSDLLPFRTGVETILGYSSGAIPTLLTGLPPSAHGHWNLFYKSPGTSPFRWTRPLGVLPARVRESRITRRLVREVSHRLSGYTGYFTTYNLPLSRMRYYDICETSDIYQARGLAPAQSLFDLLQDAGVAYDCYSYHTLSDEAILKRALQRVQSGPSRIYFLYLSGLDALLHARFRDREAVAKGLAWYEAGLRRLYRAACDRAGRARMHVFSDHGMTGVASVVNLVAAVERLGLAVPDDYLPAYDSTMARFWVHSAHAKRRLTEFLGGLGCGRIVDARELDALGVYFADGRYGDLVFVMQPGTIICPSDMGRVAPQGMHGFHPREDPGATAVFLSSDGPSDRVERLTDVLPVLLADAGLRAYGSPNQAPPLERMGA